jgi:putative transposase
MPRRPRLSTAGLFFHVVNRAAKRSTLFECAADYEAFERLLAQAVARSDVALYSYCVMPNHWHLLLSPQVDGALSRFMHWLTTTHARRWQTLRALDGQGAVYQGRFKAIPVAEDRHFLWVCRYIERNPLRAGLVGRAEDWPWSSLVKRQEKREPSYLAAWPVCCPADWIAHVNAVLTDAEEERFRKAMARGEPFGPDVWRLAVGERMGILRSGARGRHPKSLNARCPQQMTPDPLTLPTPLQICH